MIISKAFKIRVLGIGRNGSKSMNPLAQDNYTRGWREPTMSGAYPKMQGVPILPRANPYERTVK